jgi:hypothetical protein
VIGGYFLEIAETPHDNHFEFQTVHTNAHGDTVNGRVWSMRAKSEEEMKEWRESIEACQTIGGRDFFDKANQPETAVESDTVWQCPHFTALR